MRHNVVMFMLWRSIATCTSPQRLTDYVFCLNISSEVCNSLSPQPSGSFEDCRAFLLCNARAALTWLPLSLLHQRKLIFVKIFVFSQVDIHPALQEVVAPRGTSRHLCRHRSKLLGRPATIAHYEVSWQCCGKDARDA